MSSKHQYVYPTRCKKTETYIMSKNKFFLASFISALCTCFLLHTQCQILPVTQLQSWSRDIVSSARNHKTSRSCYNERAGGGRSWRHKPWHVVRWPRFGAQITLLKFNERYYGAEIYNSSFSAAALCSRHCYPHLRLQSPFFPFDVSYLSFINL